MPEGPQRNRVFLQENTKPLEGTTKNPQGRLFNPGGQFTGDPFKLAPENWMKQSDTPAHDDIITWHGSEQSQLPREDEYDDRAWESGHGTGPDWDADDAGDWDDEDYDNRYSEDSKERPMGEYGSVVGMHFGEPKAAISRSSRPYLHPVRIPNESLAEPPTGGFSTPRPGDHIQAGTYRSHRDIVNSYTGERTPDERWSDTAANFSELGTDLVEGGKTLAYRNDVEAAGSTSYRTLPETTRTWGEDVVSAKNPMTGRPASEKYGWGDDQAFRNKPHPALVAAAEAGYNPVNQPNKTGENRIFQSRGPYRGEPTQPQLPLRLGASGTEQMLTMDTAVSLNEDRAHNEASRTREEEFDAGKLWSMQKPR